MWSLIITIICLVLMILSLFYFPRIRIKKVEFDTYYLITLGFSLILLIFGLVDFNNLKELMFSKSSINPFKIIILFLSMTFMSIFLDQVGFFKYLANIAVKKCKKNQFTLFTSLYFLISLLTIFTSNDIIILTFTPFIIYFCKNARIKALPYLIGEFFAANTLSMSLLIGNPTNIYIGSSFNIDFMMYFKKMFLIGLILCFILYFLLILIFKKYLKESIKLSDENIKVESLFLVIIGLICLGLCTLFMALSSYLNFEMYLIAFIFCLSLGIICFIYNLISKKKQIILKRTLVRLPFGFVPFLLSMIIIIASLKDAGIINKVAELLNKNSNFYTYGLSAFFLGNIVNNIPMSIMYTEILKINFNFISYQEIYSVIISSNLCALFSPLGSLAGMMFLGLVKNLDDSFSFKNFMKYFYLSLILLACSFILLNFI